MACDTIVENLSGKIAILRRKTCNFSLKAYYAQEAGAIAAVIVNHYDNVAENGCYVTNMAAGTNAALVTIPSVFVGRDIGEKMDALEAASASNRNIDLGAAHESADVISVLLMGYLLYALIAPEKL